MPEITPKLAKTHPVPQHIAAFEFKLIGDLTVKQFLFAGVGIAVSYAAWISELNFFLRWAIILTAAGLGLGTAFFPIQDRTLDQWLLNFVLAISSPTQRIWRKEPQAPEFLREDYSHFLTSQVLSLTPLQSRRKLQQYLQTFEKGRPKSEVAEQEFIERLNFDIPLPGAVAVEPKPQAPPSVEEKEERLPELQELPTQPRLASEISIARRPVYKIPTEKETKYITVRRNITPGRKVRLPTIEGTIRLRPEPHPLPKEPLKELIKKPLPFAPSVPSAPSKPFRPNGRLEQLQRQNLELKTRLEEAERQLKSLGELQKELAPQEAYRERLLEQEKLVQKLSARQQKVEEEIAPKEAAPTIIDKKIPNLISGVVKDREGKLLENIVVIIKDQDGDPVRALKTNQLGQFAISTPLENGDYTVEISSKEKYFDIMKVTANGSVLAALDFREKHG